MQNLEKYGYEVFPIVVPVPNSLKSLNFFLFKNGQSLTLIDAGINHEECWKALNETLNKNGFCLNDLTEIILTHHHIDHVGLVNKIVSSHPIPVYASPHSIRRLKRDHDFLTMRLEFFERLYNEMGCRESGQKQIRYLKRSIRHNQHQALDADILGIAEKKILNFHVLELPGHSPDLLGFLTEKTGWLFSGDLLISHISSNALVEPDENGKRIQSLSQHIDSLNLIKSLNPDVVFPGHGILIEEVTPLIERRLNNMKEKSLRILKMIESGISTGNEIAQAYYHKRYTDQFSLVMSEIIGHLDFLEGTGKVKKALNNGVWQYSISDRKDE